MRLGLAAALVCTPLAAAVGAVAACGGAAFVTAPAADGGGGLLATGPAGGSGGDAASESFCILEAGTHTFCDDFDGLPLASNWSTIAVAGGGTATTDSMRSYSPPSSFESIAPAAVGYSRGRVSKVLGTASKVVVAFELWVNAAPPKLTGTAVAAGDSFVTIEIGPTYSIGLAAHDVVSYFEENTGDGGATQVLNSNPFALETSALQKAWTEVMVEVDLAHAGLSVTIGGVAELVGALITPPAAGNGTITVVLGCSAHNEVSPGLAAHFDNVTIDLTP